MAASLRQALEEAGLADPRRLAALSGDEPDLLRLLVPHQAEDPELLLTLVGMVAEAARKAPNLHARRAREAQADGLVIVAEQRRVLRRRLERTEGLERADPPKAVPPAAARWPTRLGRATAISEGPAARAELERRELARWAEKAVALVSRVGMPHSAGLRADRPLEAKLRHCARGLRASTLRQHVRHAYKVSEWTMTTFDRPWFSRLEEVEDYLEEVARRPGAGPNSFGPVLMGVRYLEMVGGAAPEMCFGLMPAVKGYAASLQGELGKTKATSGRDGVRQAPAYPLRILAAMECVVTGNHPAMVRAYA